LAWLHIDKLSRERSRNAVLNALKTLPSGLDKAYDEVMTRISSQSDIDSDLAQKVLGWITYAKQPLKAKALQHAVAIMPAMDNLDNGDLIAIEELIAVCAGMVTIDAESDTVRLVHYTTQKYLQTRLNHVKVDIASGSLAYLALKVFCAPCLKTENLEDRLRAYPFASYAATYWCEHLRGELENDLKDTCLHVFSTQGRRDSVFEIRNYSTHWSDESNDAAGSSLLHVVAASGLAILCRCLLDQGCPAYVLEY